MSGLAALCLHAVCNQAAAGPLALPTAPPVQLRQQLGQALPLDVALRASDGHATTLRAALDGGRPVVLVPGYYRCTELCGLVMQGVLESLAQSGLPADTAQVVGFSIDPQDTSADAGARERAYRDYAALAAGRAGPGAAATELRLYTAGADAASRLTQALGYAVQRGDLHAPIAHSAGFVVTSADGRVMRYFPGVRFEAREVRLALVEANAGRVGSLSDRLTLLCGHFDPASGRYTSDVLGGLRMLGTLGALALLACIGRTARGRRRAGRRVGDVP